MNPDEAYAVLSAGHPSFPKFFGAVGQLDIGVGLILNNVAFPVYNDDEADWDIAEGLVYVVSHECDIAQENDRPFNDAALVCPIIPLANVINQYLADLSAEQTKSFIHQLADSKVDRAIFVPAIPDHLPYGGVLYFSTMTSTSVRELVKPEVVAECAVTVPALKYIDDRMHHALLKRPKDQLLPLAQA
jgi:hypothetical protein